VVDEREFELFRWFDVQQEKEHTLSKIFPVEKASRQKTCISQTSPFGKIFLEHHLKYMWIKVHHLIFLKKEYLKKYTFNV
jgi:hypothetical protein